MLIAKFSCRKLLLEFAAKLSLQPLSIIQYQKICISGGLILSSSCLTKCHVKNISIHFNQLTFVWFAKRGKEIVINLQHGMFGAHEDKKRNACSFLDHKLIGSGNSLWDSKNLLLKNLST